ncbi:MAG: hypothetical protein ABI317_00675 [Gaiellales bacterium]
MRRRPDGRGARGAVDDDRALRRVGHRAAHTAERLLALQREAHARAADQTALGALDAADAEDELLERLDELGIPEAWKLVEPLVAAGLDRAWLGAFFTWRSRTGGHCS